MIEKLKKIWYISGIETIRKERIELDKKEKEYQKKLNELKKK